MRWGIFRDHEVGREGAPGEGGARSLRSSRPSIGTENFVPEEMEHREIGVCVPVMNEVKFLFASEPRKP